MDPLPPKIRLGIWADGPRLPAWLHAAVSEAAAVPGVALTHLVLDADAPRRRSARSLPFRWYERLDRYVFSTDSDPFQRKDAGALFARAEVLRLPSDAKRRAGPAIAELLADAGLDVLLHLGSRTLEGAALRVPRLGVWTWSELELARRGGVPALDAVERATPVFESQLLVLRPEGEPHGVLESSWSASDTGAVEACQPISLHRASAAACAKIAAFPARALRRLAGPGAGVSALPPAAAISHAGVPGPLRTARLAARIYGRAARRRWRFRKFDARWHVAVRPRRAEPPQVSMEGFQLLPMPGDRFFADPFLVEDGGRTFLFYEDADRRSEIGRIACVELDARGRPGRAAPVLEEPHHLSYPCVFAWGGAWWMVPESCSARRVDLYRAEEFPWRWRHERTLFHDVRAVDATVFPRNGRLWMFVAMAGEGSSAQDELFLFHADDPRGPWTPHAQNPIASDVRCARPAGRVFEEDGQIYRLGQDCSRAYGGAIALQRVDVLKEDEYRESPAARIEAGWLPGSVATHTFDRTSSLEVVDVRILEPRP